MLEPVVSSGAIKLPTFHGAQSFIIVPLNHILSLLNPVYTSTPLFKVRHKRGARTNTVMNFRIPYSLGKFLTR
jgi:hypothetical protein